MDFVADVKRAEVKGADVWTAHLPGGTRFEAATEEALRADVRAHLLDQAARAMGRAADTLTAKLTRTWRVRVTEVDAPRGEEEEEEAACPGGFSLFD